MLLCKIDFPKRGCNTKGIICIVLVSVAIAIFSPLNALAGEHALIVKSKKGLHERGFDRRIALVIGNGNYHDSALALRNPVNDATDMANALTQVGFEVIQRRNAGRKEMFTAIKEFGQKLKKNDVGLFYYAGHGVQVDNVNYLIPVDLVVDELKDADDLRRDAVPLGEIFDKLKESNTYNIVILDACRDNPFVARFSRSSSRGLARVVTPAETAILYATDPGSTASDGANVKNGVFTSRMIEVILQEGLELVDAMREVAKLVAEDTKNMQRPVFDGVLPIKFYFSPAKHEAAKGSTNGNDAEKEAWGIIRNSNDKADFKDFLDKFPNGNYNKTAKLKLRQLEKEELERIESSKAKDNETLKKREHYVPMPSP